ncbi:hypothetical protein E2562_025445 [Oryza meyeriana var. granulata]|uniref:Uncharacterized protein n=1 Tax=Oryza meyeriana var. granulata TaxID=110450 RepID=A0A6G1D7T2_9ORYZ|nr:hypothetical protein E2562_025445 [Oryza meyeriana var. granulata]
MADPVIIPMPAAPAFGVEQIIDAAGPADDDDTDRKLRRALVGGGTGKIAAALLLSLFRSPGGVFVHGKVLFYAYYGIVLAVAVFGAVEVGVGYWISASPSNRRRGIGKLLIWASVLPIVAVTALGGFAVLK